MAVHAAAWNDTTTIEVTGVEDPEGIHDPRSEYVERFWLGIIGPATTWLLRALARELDRHPDGFRLDTAEAAAALGLRAGSKHSPFERSLARSCKFGLAHSPAPGHLVVRRRLPALSPAQIDRLPGRLRADHERWPAPTARAEIDLQRAVELARTMLQLGEGVEETDAQLARLRIGPEVRRHALFEAWDNLAGAP